jgi:hypothetical protein
MPVTHTQARPADPSLLFECAGDGRERVVSAAAGVFADLARRAGYRSAGVFTDVRDESGHGFAALVSALRRKGVGAVVVPELSHPRQGGCLAGAGAVTATRFLQADLLVVGPGCVNDCGVPDVKAPGTDPGDGPPEPGRRDVRVGSVGVRR